MFVTSHIATLRLSLYEDGQTIDTSRTVGKQNGSDGLLVPSEQMATTDE
jgi:hypothetical protein